MSELFKLEILIDNLSEAVLLERFDQIYQQHGYIDFMLDRTVDIEMFSEIIDTFDPLMGVEKFFPARPPSYKDKAPLVLLRFRHDQKYKQYIPQIIELLLEQPYYTSTRQIIVGWGYSKQPLDLIKNLFQKNSIAQLEKSKKTFFLRWYDPRIQYIFQNISPEILYQHHLKEYELWEYLHPKGIYIKQQVENKFRFNNIYPSYVIDFLILSEDVNCINKYIASKGIFPHDIDAMQTYEYLLAIQAQQHDIEISISSDLIFWFYKTSPELIKHPDFYPLWQQGHFTQIIETLNHYSDMEVDTLTRGLTYG